MQFSFLSKNSFLGSSSSIKRDDFFWKWTNEWGKSIVGSNPLLIVHITRGMLSFSPFPYAGLTLIFAFFLKAISLIWLPSFSVNFVYSGAERSCKSAICHSPHKFHPRKSGHFFISVFI